MRVYQSGQMIPMDHVTWDTMCSPRTVVTEEDPGIDFPPAVRQAEREALLRIAEALRAKKSLITKLREYAFGTSNAPRQGCEAYPERGCSQGD